MGKTANTISIYTESGVIQLNSDLCGVKKHILKPGRSQFCNVNNKLNCVKNMIKDITNKENYPSVIKSRAKLPLIQRNCKQITEISRKPFLIKNNIICDATLDLDKAVSCDENNYCNQSKQSQILQRAKQEKAGVSKEHLNQKTQICKLDDNIQCEMRKTLNDITNKNIANEGRRNSCNQSSKNKGNRKSITNVECINVLSCQNESFLDLKTGPSFLTEVNNFETELNSKVLSSLNKDTCFKKTVICTQKRYSCDNFVSRKTATPKLKEKTSSHLEIPTKSVESGRNFNKSNKSPFLGKNTKIKLNKIDSKQLETENAEVTLGNYVLKAGLKKSTICTQKRNSHGNFVSRKTMTPKCKEKVSPHLKTCTKSLKSKGNFNKNSFDVDIVSSINTQEHSNFVNSAKSPRNESNNSPSLGKNIKIKLNKIDSKQLETENAEGTLGKYVLKAGLKKSAICTQKQNSHGNFVCRKTITPKCKQKASPHLKTYTNSLKSKGNINENYFDIHTVSSINTQEQSNFVNSAKSSRNEINNSPSLVKNTNKSDSKKTLGKNIFSSNGLHKGIEFSNMMQLKNKRLQDVLIYDNNSLRKLTPKKEKPRINILSEFKISKLEDEGDAPIYSIETSKITKSSKTSQSIANKAITNILRKSRQMVEGESNFVTPLRSKKKISPASTPKTVTKWRDCITPIKTYSKGPRDMNEQKSAKKLKAIWLENTTAGFKGERQLQIKRTKVIIDKKKVITASEFKKQLLFTDDLKRTEVPTIYSKRRFFGANWTAFDMLVNPIRAKCLARKLERVFYKRCYRRFEPTEPSYACLLTDILPLRCISSNRSKKTV